MMKKLSYTLLIAFLLTGLMGCEGSSTGVKADGQPPQIPDLAKQAEPNISFFKNNSPDQSSGSYDHYYDARRSAMSLGSVMFSIINKVYLGFLPKENATAQFKNGVWTWTYTHTIKKDSGEKLSFDVKFTAKELASSVSWAMYCSYDNGHGNTIKKYKLMEGTISNNGTSGNWTLNALGDSSSTETPFIKATWDYPSSTQKKLTYKIFSNEGTMSGTLHYTQKGAVYNVVVNYLVGSQSQTIIHWNTDTHEGYYMSDGQKECWDSNFKNKPCGGLVGAY